jgi:hypothetical protein
MPVFSASHGSSAITVQAAQLNSSTADTTTATDLVDIFPCAQRQHPSAPFGYIAEEKKRRAQSA